MLSLTAVYRYVALIAIKACVHWFGSLDLILTLIVRPLKLIFVAGD